MSSINLNTNEKISEYNKILENLDFNIPIRKSQQYYNNNELINKEEIILDLNKHLNYNDLVNNNINLPSSLDINHISTNRKNDNILINTIRFKNKYTIIKMYL